MKDRRHDPTKKDDDYTEGEAEDQCKWRHQRRGNRSTFHIATPTDEELAYFHKVDIKEVEEKAYGGDNHRKEHSSKTDDEVIGLVHCYIFCMSVVVELPPGEVCYVSIFGVSLVMITPDIEAITNHVSHQEEGADNRPGADKRPHFTTHYILISSPLFFTKHTISVFLCCLAFD